MNLCSHNHDEICFEGIECPMCALIDEHIKKLDELDDEIGQLKGDLADLQSDNARLEQMMADPLVEAVAEKRKEKYDQQRQESGESAT